MPSPPEASAAAIAASAVGGANREAANVASARARAVAGIRRFFTGAGLPVFLFAAVTLYEAFLLALVFLPAELGWLGGFAREFRVWCFSYDPRTGGMDWSSVGMMLLEPLFIVAVAWLLWRRALQLRRCLHSWRAATAGLVTAAAAIASLLALGPRATADEPLPPFPGERIRTRLVPPAFRLTDQTGRECALDELRGRVVLVTGVYALCGTTCPQILVATRQLLDSLPADARERVTVLALSLNPEYETAPIMSAVAAGYGFTHPEFRYLNGPPEVMHGVLDAFQFARFRDPRTGVIEHANLLLLLDARGEIAFRFNLNPRHQAWLREALIALAAEAKAESAPGATAAEQ